MIVDMLWFCQCFSAGGWSWQSAGSALVSHYLTLCLTAWFSPEQMLMCSSSSLFFVPFFFIILVVWVQSVYYQSSLLYHSSETCAELQVQTTQSPNELWIRSFPPHTPCFIWLAQTRTPCDPGEWCQLVAMVMVCVYGPRGRAGMCHCFHWGPKLFLAELLSALEGTEPSLRLR